MIINIRPREAFHCSEFFFRGAAKCVRLKRKTEVGPTKTTSKLRKFIELEVAIIMEGQTRTFSEIKSDKFDDEGSPTVTSQEQVNRS